MRDAFLQHHTVVAGGSAFNVKAKSLRLGDFSRDEVTALLGQHTAETGQALMAGALERVWERMQGQPWLVNALADRDRSWPIDAEAILAMARQAAGRPTHDNRRRRARRDGEPRKPAEPALQMQRVVAAAAPQLIGGAKGGL